MKQVVLITGVGKRLGLALAEHFLSAGYHVVGTYRTEYEKISELKKQGCDLYQVDFYAQNNLDAFIAAIKDKYTHLELLVHNASDWLSENKTEANKADIFDRMMKIHASLPYQLNLAFQDLLIGSERGFSDIIHITDYVIEKGSAKHIAYSASKAALDNLSLSFASLFGPKIKVNSIAPALLKFNPSDDTAYQQKTLKKAIIEREGGFNEVINAISFIHQSQFMTGRTIHLDGGRHIKP